MGIFDSILKSLYKVGNTFGDAYKDLTSPEQPTILQQSNTQQNQDNGLGGILGARLAQGSPGGIGKQLSEKAGQEYAQPQDISQYSNPYSLIAMMNQIPKQQAQQAPQNFNAMQLGIMQYLAQLYGGVQ